ncbi:hypothetical protein AB1Y20_003644 [Prymnesium parvum]|uniref:Bifunctional lysine-specific demethylase and histidyl-hydroxylase n=1 Tax=Prymnesium parvum TaxID=97485 RepID=A0AB34J892_PRYPA
MARKNSRASPPPHPPPRPPHKPHSKAHGTPRATAWCSAASFTVVLLALLAASLRPAPALAPHRHLAAAAAEGDGAGGEACLNIAHLWDGRNATAPLGCEGFVRHYWEVAPRLSFAGAEFSNSLMRLGDIRSMLRTFRFRIHKNHGTVVLQEPGSGFLADRRWSRGDDVPADIVEIALREMRTLVLHNLEVYWPAVAAFTRDVVRFFHTYTQVNLYFSPAGLRVATSPHQDAHCVFIVQLHGAKRWHVHAPLSTQLTLKGLQRGKFGEILSSDDRALMGPALVNATLRPGSVLYVPRGFFHHTSTDPAALAAPGVFADASTHTDVAETREGVAHAVV